jgi:hypothetical protein
MNVPPLELPPLEELLGQPKPIPPEERDGLLTENAQLKQMLVSLQQQHEREQAGSPAQPAPQPTLPRDPEQAARALRCTDV